MAWIFIPVYCFAISWQAHDVDQAARAARYAAEAVAHPRAQAEGEKGGDEVEAEVVGGGEEGGAPRHGRARVEEQETREEVHDIFVQKFIELQLGPRGPAQAGVRKEGGAQAGPRAARLRRPQRERGDRGEGGPRRDLEEAFERRVARVDDREMRRRRRRPPSDELPLFGVNYIIVRHTILLYNIVETVGGTASGPYYMCEEETKSLTDRVEKC